MRFTRLILCLVSLAIAITSLFAQSGGTGTILGTVTDSSGAVIQGAKIIVTNTATGTSSTVESSSSGDFQVTSLQPGGYSVSVEVPAFKKWVARGLVLTVDQKLRVNSTLSPGEVTATVEVAAQSLALDTDSTSLSQLVSQQQVEQLPLNGRNFMQLLLVTPGAVTVGGEQGTMRSGVGNAVSVNGGRPEGNNYTLDGLVNTDPALVTPAVILSQDAIQEFKVESGTYSAEYGFSASQINIVSKGGTNQLHGALFESNRNDAYDAHPFPNATTFQTGKPTQKSVLRQNQFGFVANGPVYIPKVYNGHNRTFWMANYEGWRITNGIAENWMLPNPALLTGNFNGESYAPVSGQPGGVLPAFGSASCTALLNANKNCMPIDPNTGQPFPNNQIPAARITNNLANVAIANKYFLTPTAANQPEGIPNFVGVGANPLVSNQQTYRIDQNLGKFGSVFGRFTYAKYKNSNLTNSTPVYGVQNFVQTEKSWAISHSITLGKATANNFRFGYLEAQAPQGGPPPPSSIVSALGVKGTFTTFTDMQLTWPYLVLAGFNNFGGPLNSYTGSESPLWEFADSFTTIRGKHTLGIGIDYRRYSLTRNTADDFLGDWTYNANTILNNSANCATPSGKCGTGNSIADFLLGYYNNVAGFTPGPLSPTDTAGNPQKHIFAYLGPYVQDEWKATQNLTVNLGLRWDYRAAPYEEKNHFFWLDNTNARGGLCYADPTLTTNGVAPGADSTGAPILRYCGSVPRPGSKTPFAPRFGIAYRMGNKMVLRGGYGIFFDSYEGREIDNSGDIYPYSIRQGVNPTTTNADKIANNQFPSFTKLTAFPAASLSTVAVIQSDNPSNPYVQSWTGSFQRELARNLTLEVNYIGTHSVHLMNRHNIAQANAIPAANLAACQANPQDTTNNCPTSTRRPYPNFTGIYLNSDFHGYSHYNAMNVKLERRATNLAATVIYTFAKSQDNKSAAAGVGASNGFGWQGYMDNHHPELDYGLSDFDVQNRFVSTFIYSLPFGRGQKFAGNINRAADLAIGGWQVTGITTFQAGFPFGMAASDASSLLGTFGQRANYTPGCNLGANLTAPYQRINMSCFSQPAPGVYGNSQRNFMRQPGLNNWDIGAGKTFNIAERLHFQLNAQAFNAFNHHQYAVNVGGLAVSGVGGGSAIDGNINDTNAGRIVNTTSARIVQISGKIIF